MISSFDKEVARLRLEARNTLIQAVVDTKLDGKICRAPDRGREVMAQSLEQDWRPLAARIRMLERAVGRNPPLYRRYRPLISAIRELRDPTSGAAAGLFHEICFVLTLSGRKSLPWARRR